MENNISESAPAKVNLYLHILGRRSDGYHVLDSLIVFVDFGDHVTLIARAPYTLSISGPFARTLLEERKSDNLVWRAATAFAERVGRTLDTSIHLQKLLPIAAGLGGGTTDATACLRALARLWNIDPSHTVLKEVAQTIGCDGAVCLYPRPWFIGGVGESLFPAPSLPPCSLVLINPRIPLSTTEIFQNFKGPFSLPGRFQVAPKNLHDFVTLLSQRHNDLTTTAIQKLPLISEILSVLKMTPGCHLARISGSGATCFGLYESPYQAQKAADSIQQQHPQWWVQYVTLTENKKYSHIVTNKSLMIKRQTTR